MLEIHGSADPVIKVGGGQFFGGLFTMSRTRDSAALLAQVNSCGPPTVTSLGATLRAPLPPATSNMHVQRSTQPNTSK
eukprot:3368706-Prymnesium_polylepis.2